MGIESIVKGYLVDGEGEFQSGLPSSLKFCILKPEKAMDW
jgi:hypothetical protein